MSQQETQRLPPGLAAWGGALCDWDAHIQGHRVAVQSKLRAEVRRLTPRLLELAPGMVAMGVRITAKGLLAQGLEEPRDCDAGVEHVEVCILRALLALVGFGSILKPQAVDHGCKCIWAFDFKRAACGERQRTCTGRARAITAPSRISKIA